MIKSRTKFRLHTINVVKHVIAISRQSHASVSQVCATYHCTDYDLKLTTSTGSYITGSSGYTNIEYINYNNTSNSTLKIVLNQYSAQIVNDGWDYGGITWCYE